MRKKIEKITAYEVLEQYSGDQQGPQDEGDNLETVEDNEGKEA